MNIPHQGFGKQAMIAAIQIAIKKGGFAAYKLAVIVANAVCRTLLGRSLSFAANATLTRWLSVFAGPIGWAITTIWTAIDIAGPAYRVTIPAVIQIAYMRTKINYIEDNNIENSETVYNIPEPENKNDNKNVLEYKIANNNVGCTIVKLKK